MKEENKIEKIYQLVLSLQKNKADKEDLKLYATKKDLDDFKNEVREKFKQTASKEDLKIFATKDDLKRFVTKDDLKRFVTKDDLKRFATKDDLAVVKFDLQLVKDEVNDLKAEVRRSKHEILDRIDDFINLHKNVALEVVSLRSKYDRLKCQRGKCSMA